MESRQNVFERIGAEGVVATVSIDDFDKVAPLAETVLAAGLSCIELTLRTECAVDAIQLIRQRYPEMLVGAGTVLTREQVRQVSDAGAQFAVAPGLNPAVAEESSQIGLPFAPGVCTPSEVEAALAHGCRHLKFFPAEGMGGIDYLKSMAAPYLHIGVDFLPLGGIGEDNFMDYLKQPFILAVGGSWLAPRACIASGDWERIGDLCGRAKAKIKTLNRRTGII